MRDVFGVRASQRFTCEQNYTNIHIMGADLRLMIGAINERPKRPSVDLRGSLVGRKKYRRLIEEPPFDDHIARAQSLALPL